MAIITCHSLKGNVQKAIDYITDARKVAENCIGSLGANIHTAGLEWKLKKQKGMKVREETNYDEITGYHFIQSFPAGSISHEEAFDMAQEWIDEILKGKYDYVIATHKDKAHVHTHIIVNPMNNITGKNIDIFFKRDLPLFKEINDKVCIRHNKEVLENPKAKYGTTYYEWMIKNKADNHKTIIKKTLDDVLQRVKNYEEFKSYLAALGFVVEDGSKRMEEEPVETESSFYFSANQKLVIEEKETESFYYVRIPYSKNYVYVPKEDCKWTTDKKTMFVEMNNKSLYETYLTESNTFTKSSINDIKKYFEKKQKEHTGRKGLRIKVPGGNKFIRCNRIDNGENDKGYSLDYVIQKIESNGQYISDPEIEDVIERSQNKDEQKKARERYYEKVGIKEDYKYSRFHQYTPKERYIYAKMKNINNMLLEIRSIRARMEDTNTINSLTLQKQKVKEELDGINVQLKEAEKDYEEMLQQQMEGLLSVTEQEKEEYVQNKIIPLRESRKILVDEIHQINTRIEKKKEQERG